MICKNSVPFSETTFEDIETKVDWAISELLKQDLAKQRIAASLASPQGSNLSFDGRWSHRRNAREGTVSAIDLEIKKIIDVQHIEMCSKLHKDDEEEKKCSDNNFQEITLEINKKKVIFNKRTRNYHGTSKSMEGFGVSQICKRLKSENFTIANITHDNDASTVLQVKESFPEIQEFLDNNHTRKNIVKALDEVRKDFVKLKKELKSEKIDIGKDFTLDEMDRISKNFRNSALQSAGNPKLFQNRFLNYWNHSFGMCNEFCMHKLKEVRKHFHFSCSQKFSNLIDNHQKGRISN